MRAQWCSAPRHRLPHQNPLQLPRPLPPLLFLPVSRRRRRKRRRLLSHRHRRERLPRLLLPRRGRRLHRVPGSSKQRLTTNKTALL